MIGRRFDVDRRTRRPRRRDGPPQGRLVLPDGAGHEPDADRRPHVHDRLHPRHHGAQRTRGARPRRVRGGADRQRHHLSRRPDRAGQPGGLQHARADRRRARWAGTSPISSIPRIVHTGAAALDALVQGGTGTRRFEGRYLRHGGRIIEASVAVSAIRDDRQEVIQLFTQIEDVTDARRTTRELEQSQFEMLARLAAAAELHDDDTGRHTHRVGELSVKIAERLGLPDGQLRLVPLAAALHDVGKIAIPDAVLAQAGQADQGRVRAHEDAHHGGGADALRERVRARSTGRRRSRSPTTRSGTAAATRRASRGRRSRSPAASSRSPTSSTRSPTHGRTSARGARAERSPRCERQSGRHFDPQVLDAFLSRRPEPSGAVAAA